MTNKYIWLNNRRYYRYDTYDSWREAYNIGRLLKQRHKSRYYILQSEAGFLVPRMVYTLYTDKVIVFW